MNAYERFGSGSAREAEVVGAARAVQLLALSDLDPTGIFESEGWHGAEAIV
jgi:hypothetical protein